jgi:hypothetical protein
MDGEPFGCPLLFYYIIDLVKVLVDSSLDLQVLEQVVYPGPFAELVGPPLVVG